MIPAWYITSEMPAVAIDLHPQPHVHLICLLRAFNVVGRTQDSNYKISLFLDDQRLSYSLVLLLPAGERGNPIYQVMVTGSSGFIGGNVCIWLLRMGCDVLEHRGRNDAKITSSALPDSLACIVNCAGLLGGEGHDSRTLRKANIDFPITLGEISSRLRIPLVHLSTPGVTGLRADSTEMDEFKPWGEYEQTKAECEIALKRLFEHSDSELTILRPDFVYGPGDFHKLALFRQVDKGWFPLVGSGSARFRPTYIDDICTAVGASLPGGCLAGGTFNIAGPQIVTVLGLVKTIANLMDKSLIAIPVPRFVYRLALFARLAPSTLSRSRLALFGLDHYCNIDRAIESGWTPKIDLYTGLGRTIEWYRGEGLL